MAIPQGTNPFLVIAKEDENITVTTSFTTLFTVDLEGYADGVLNIRNDDATNTLEYKIYGSPKQTDTLPIDSDDSWTNILDLSTDPQDYNDGESKIIPTKTTFYESLSNKFRWFRIQMKTTSGTITAKVWFRGRNIK